MLKPGSESGDFDEIGLDGLIRDDRVHVGDNFLWNPALELPWRIAIVFVALVMPFGSRPKTWRVVEAEVDVQSLRLLVILGQLLIRHIVELIGVCCDSQEFLVLLNSA